MTKGPMDRIEELRQKTADLQRRIKAGESGDGRSKPDLTAQLQVAAQELRTLESANKPRRMYPSMKQ